ncbi:MAG TPA: DUF3306 domain-containing protein [Afifellaceae bacterium]|nr:DUF3306 domain-containing protein [Afifellaceae bacterium]
MAERKDHTPEDRPFLSRWSERKQRAELEAADRQSEAGPDQVEGADDETADEELAANQAAAEAIDLDSLDEDSDYSPFLKDGVPADLKSAALQRLWRSNPVFANIDGLNDYDEDFTIPTTPMGAIKTAWKFGRGFLTDDDIADKDKTAAEPETVESAEGDDEAVAKAVTSELDPVRLDPVGDKEKGSEPAGISQPDDATGEKPDPRPAPSVGLRNRLDMAAFSGRDDD